MSPGELAQVRIRRLLAEMAEERRALDARWDDLVALVATDDGVARTLALGFTLDRSYTALEALIERVTRSLEGEVPSGHDWHQRLLSGARLAIEGVRPAILTAGTADLVDELRRFRHFARHAYARELEALRVSELAQAWIAARPTLTAELNQFEAFLRQLAEAE